MRAARKKSPLSIRLPERDVDLIDRAAVRAAEGVLWTERSFE